jgi:hypothetical protein
MRNIPTAEKINPTLFFVSPIANKNIINKIKKKTAESAFIDFMPA